MVTEATSHVRRTSALLATAALALTMLVGCGGDDEQPTPATSAAASAEAATGRTTLLDAQELDVLDQPIAYPKKQPAQISSVLVTIEPGQETGWHRHRVPLYAYVLEGNLTVEYDAGVVKEYPTGTAFMEAEDIWHNGINKGDDAVRILTVYLGAEGKKNTVERAS